jgi:hypothetical protein
VVHVKIILETGIVFGFLLNWLFFGPFAADVEKLALVCFSFVLFFAESTRVV